MDKDLLWTIVAMISTSAAVFCGIYLLLTKVWGARLNVEEQLNSMATAEKQKKSEDKEKKSFSLFRVSDALRNNLELAQIKMEPEEFIFICIFGIAIPALISLVLTARIEVMLIIGALCSWMPWFIVKRKIGKQRKLFERQLGDALMVLSNAIRAGFSFQQALSNVANDLSDPISREFLSISRDLQLGGDVEASMLHVADRMQSSDLRLITTAVVIQRQVGGNLSEILDTISQTIRDRLAIKRTILALTAQGRISGKVIGGMPIVLLGVIYLMNPTYIEPLFTDTRGIIMLVLSAVMEILGFVVINKIVNIKF